MWRCKGCGEKVEDHFEACWSCQATKGQSDKLPLQSTTSYSISQVETNVESDGWECLACGADVTFEDKTCPTCGADVTEVGDHEKGPEEDVAPIKTTSFSISKQVSAVMKRYADAYIVARFIVGMGSFLKGIGIVVAIVLCLLGVLTGNTMRTDPTVSLVAGGISGGIVGLFFYVWGIFVSAQGQILKASLDTAVHSSPFLTDEHRVKVMSLPDS